MKRSTAFVIALLGAESTGKTTLAHSIGDALAASASSAPPRARVAVVPEYLREFCNQHGRTPRREEQQHIADEQTRRIANAALDHDIVIADTTALMIAVYSEQVFGDTSLYKRAEADHARSDLTLLTALDLPWLPDGLQRDGPHVREPVDARVRAALERAQCDYSVVFGSGSARLEATLACIDRALNPPLLDDEADGAAQPRWQWYCERCGEAHCEHRSLRLS
jgi:nicotinamide riboside kinase